MLILQNSKVITLKRLLFPKTIPSASIIILQFILFLYPIWSSQQIGKPSTICLLQLWLREVVTG